MIETIITQIQRHAEYNKIQQSAISDLILYRADYLTESLIYMQQAGVYAVFQGEKAFRIGQRHFHLRAGDVILHHTSLPIIINSLTASADKPYLALCFKLNEAELGKLVRQMPEGRLKKQTAQANHIPISPELTSAFSRVLNLLDMPEDTDILLPLLRREIHYYLLKSPLGGQLAKLFDQGRRFQPVRQAVQWLENHFTEPLNVEILAAEVGMSHTNFFRCFKEMTGFSPLEYQKSLRLMEARQLLKQGRLKVTTAAFQVGYESAVQFSREYQRYFGTSPKQDRIAKL
ncbi:AraC family transcriptional regulator [Neisseria perflava]|uniref:AraC family transcriptional regulator n=1 Tax=Neisseria perflava TaxID=33053 RepID=UPI00209CF5F6|nr:AraC family transcriptional regulator [Neisseria perflava]MCP1659864.1 AraC-like DNA-binding protein [Neisseria perflava]MCP1772668.1 AraC-like DNA-binding protein [Neisseria perflava]